MSDQAIAVTAENQAEVLAAAEAAKAGTLQLGDKPAAQTVLQQEQSPAPATKDGPPAELEIPETPAEEVVPFSLTPYYEEFAKAGNLSDESRKTLTERLTKAFDMDEATASTMIDQHMAGAKASVESHRQAIFAHVGGESAYSEMVQWASKNLAMEDIQAFNEAVKDPKLVKLTVLGLQAQYNAAKVGAPATKQQAAKQVAPQSNVLTGMEPVRSDQQVAELVGDKRFLTDPGYRQLVEQRILASMKAGYLK